jgi:predicted protein tyrosine phosphatase
MKRLQTIGRSLVGVLLILSLLSVQGCFTLPKAQKAIEAADIGRINAWTMGNQDAATYWRHSEWHQTVFVVNKYSREELQQLYTAEERAEMLDQLDQLDNARALQKAIFDYLAIQLELKPKPETIPAVELSPEQQSMLGAGTLLQIENLLREYEAALLTERQRSERLEAMIAKVPSESPEGRTPDIPPTVPKNIDELVNLIQPSPIQVEKRFTSRDLEDILLNYAVPETHAQYVTSRIHSVIGVENPFQEVAPVQDDIAFTVFLEYIYGYLTGMDKVLPETK